MAEKNIQMQRKTATGYDKYYPKTKAGLVEFADGTTVEAHKSDYASKQFGNRPYVSTASKTYYIDAVSGSDENGGESAGDAFATFEKCFSLVPIFLNHNYTIRIIGNYSDVIVVRQVFATRDVTLLFRGDTNDPDNHVTGGVNFYACLSNTVGIILEYVKLTNDTIYVRGCQGVAIRNCKPQRSGGTGIGVESGGCWIQECDFGTDVAQDAIVAGANAKVLSLNNTGNATRYGLRALNNGTIGKNGTRPTGTTANEYEAFGGVIR